MTKMMLLCAAASVTLLAACSSRPSVAVAAAAAQAAPTTAPAPATPNMTSIASVWNSRTALAGKKITLHGTVVKFNGGILGVNWIHIQDGTGKAEDGTNDITITSDMTAKVGDAITATGVVALDKDLGSGYFYKVIVEKATIERALSANK